MKVKVFGPNLNDQSKGTFHVHEHDCVHSNQYGPGRRYGGQYPAQEATVEVSSTHEVVEYCYSDQIDERMHEETTREDEIDDLLNDFWFAPCTEGLPTNVEHPKVGDTYECWVADQKNTFHKLKSDDQLGVVRWLMDSLSEFNMTGAHIHIVVHHSDEYYSPAQRVIEPELEI